MDWDVCVVGAGPAGLSAATAIAERGVAVVVVDEQPRAGGQYYRQASADVVAAHGEHRPAGARLVGRAEHAGVRFRFGMSVWGVGDDGRTLLLTTNNGSTVQRLSARKIVVATGATERSLPFSGWQLPGVTTVGYAQHLATEGVPVGERVLIAGSGPFLLSVACSLVAVGAEVVAVLEEGTPYRPRRNSLRAALEVARLREFASYRMHLARARVRLRSGWRVVGARQEGAQLRVVTSPVDAGVANEYVVDALCVGYGFRPQVDLPHLLGCATRTDPASGDEVVVVDDAGATTVPGIWAAGEVGGIAGAEVALTEGAVVAKAVLADLGVGARPRSPSTRSGPRARAAIVSALYPAPRELAARAAAALPDEALACRCESVSAGTVRAAARAGGDIHTVKSATRAGMGPCQGRECAPGVAALCGSDASAFTARVPLRPVPLSAIAAAADPR